MTTTLLWFRNDLRLTDNRVLAAALIGASQLLPVYCRAPDEDTTWGFPRIGPHRRRFLDDTLRDLQQRLRALGSDLLVLDGRAQVLLPALAREHGVGTIHAEEIPAPEEQDEINALREAGLTVRTHWQSSLLDPSRLPFRPAQVPEVFTRFRNDVERAGIQPWPPLAAPTALPPLPSGLVCPALPSPDADRDDPRSAFPYRDPAWCGGETAALAHIERYFGGRLPTTYKATRNGLTGLDYATKLSPWLASGALSPRTVFAALRAHEARCGESDGSYWIWFELLWRDHFRLLHVRHGRRLYRARGLGDQPPPRHHAGRFDAWREGRTGQPFIDAAMRDLAATGFLSNRMRQNVASYLIHDLGGDWRAGAAWFEACLIDYDACSNQGNWLYLAGRGTDPRGSRRFNPDKQAGDYDADGAYRRLWATS